MRRQTDRMTRIIEDLLELSRFEANDAPIKGPAIDVAAMAASLRKMVLARATHPRQVDW
jgi:signal transduction histidine kinase